jgi:hypothetical protein
MEDQNLAKRIQVFSMWRCVAGRVDPWNVGNHSPNDTASNPRRLYCSTTPLWETEISQSVRRIKIAVFEEVKPRNLADKHLRFGKTCCLHPQHRRNVEIRRTSLHCNAKGKETPCLSSFEGFQFCGHGVLLLHHTGLWCAIWHSLGWVYEDNRLLGRDAVSHGKQFGRMCFPNPKLSRSWSMVDAYRCSGVTRFFYPEWQQ